MSLTVLADYTRDNIIADKIGVEGAYTDNPDDPGGATKFGVIQRTADQYKAALVAQFGWSGNIRDFTQPMAVYVYIQEFWNKILGDQILAIAPLLADKLFDIAINTGKDEAVTFLQKVLNALNMKAALYPDLTIDGQIGQKSIQAIAAFYKARGNAGLARLLFAVECLQGAYYIDISLKNERLETFTYGWEGRVTRDVERYSKLLGMTGS